ncbi:MAG TPA: nucleotide disphospho-sugar-binding domain-containing protein [Oligoflexus sp.]|uniref:nucleotide disphospho-sugar-binding domain-containing protein n=1 Tax=Oligoflexus sp. TaxID=1971216 RepID=UPI002D68CC25|nr:nucleotide disphospho-sugar-binding domain-containing protein [Oligoflexus sp.]HYX38571.1 nucleotide disphospho-sugar-binding domain-containing protein [Oligoflexus sp.]
MSRYMLVVPPLAGHINPTIAIGRRLLAAGDDVTWVGCGRRVRALLPHDLPLIPIWETATGDVNESWMHKAQKVTGLESFQFFYEEFLVPLTDAMLPGVLAAIDEFQPDVILSDQQALAGALAARLRHCPWATLATTSAAVFNPIAQMPKVREWMVETLGKVQDRYELERWERPDLSSDLVLILSVRELIAAEEHIPNHFHFIGPSIREEQNDDDFPWHLLHPERKKVYLSLGTVNAERSQKFYQKVKEAFADQDLQMILSAPADMLGAIPDNFIVQRFVPQLALLKKVDAVIFHGGHNTFCETLLHGLPAVVAPIKDDQPVIAEQLVRSGAGLRVHFDRVKSPDLAAATQRVLNEPQFRTAAERIQKILRASGGSAQAVELLQGMVR